jgi:NTE family protein
MKTALVLSGGAMFGAWQAGVWAELENHYRPDLIVGASVGALNGYAIACGATGDRLAGLWRDPQFASIASLERNIREMTAQYKPRMPFALTVTDVLRMKPVLYRDQEITWRHMAASCAVPLVFRQRWIDGHLCSDGGLLNPLPLWAAVELGATHIVALNVLPNTPGWWLKPLTAGFRMVFGHNPPVPPGVQVELLTPSEALGGVSDAMRHRPENIEKWLALGKKDAKNISIHNCLER